MKKKMLFMTLFLVTAVTSFQKIIAMRNLIGLFFLSVALAACTSAPRNEVLSYTDFPRTLELKGRTLPLDTALFFPHSCAGRPGSCARFAWRGLFLPCFQLSSFLPPFLFRQAWRSSRRATFR